MVKGDKSRVLAIGLDGATLDLIEPWIAEGRLPTLKKMRDSGAWGTLTTEFPPATVPGWPSFMTGTNPGKHGVIFWIEKSGKDNTFRVKNGTSVRGPTIWDILGDHGKRSIVINVPCTYPPRPINGLLITGMLSPPGSEWAYPPGLAGEVEDAVGEYIIFPREVYSAGRERHFIAELHLAEDRRYRTAKYLMGNHDWDFFMVHFQSTDIIQHAFWHYLDPAHPRHEADGASRYGREILQLYQLLDSFIADLQAMAGEDTYCFVVSDHGAGPLHKRTQLNNWLLEEGLLRLRRSPFTRFKYWAFRHGFTMENVYRVMLRLRLANLRKAVDARKRGGGMLRQAFLSFRDVDWARTKAYVLGGQVYITTGGENSEEYIALREQIAQGLVMLTIGSSDEKLVSQVHRREDIFHGPELSKMPDLLPVIRGHNYEEAGDFEFFSNKLVHEPLGIFGNHRMDGIVFLSGPEVLRQERLEGASLIDIAPTILYLLGVPVPDSMDGQVLRDAFSSDFLARYRVLKKEETPTSEAPAEGMSESEEEEIKTRLRGLGYL